MFNRNGNNGKRSGVAHANGSGPRPAAAIPAEHEIAWDGLPPGVVGALSQPLDPALASRRQGRGGRVFEYLEGHAVIDQANRIFGYGGWGYELVGDVTLRQFDTVDAHTGEVVLASVYMAPVRVTVAGALPRTDLGFHAVTDETPDGHDTASKGAVTDGMKRAFRSFGVQFGNGFYGDQPPPAAAPRREGATASAGADSGSSQANGRGDSGAEALLRKLMELCAKQGFDGAQVQDAVRRQTGKSTGDLTAEELEELIEAAANKLNQMGQGKTA